MDGSSSEPAYVQADWRLLVEGEADGASNMAIDEAIHTAVVEEHSPPTLRLYAWAPPCLSLGRNQPLSDVDLPACAAAGVDVVRRATGGRAILHTDELTYSLALLQSDPRSTGDVKESYRRLSEGLLAGLRSLGADVAQASLLAEGARDVTAVCFETPSDYEIVALGRKLVGSAQWRARGGVLQHGTLPLTGDLARIVDYLRFSGARREDQRRAVHTRAVTLEEALGRYIPFAAAAQAIAGGFARALNLNLIPGELTLHERYLADQLRRNRYTTSDWNARA